MANFTVTSAEDDEQAPPPGSLREAIDAANNNPGPDTIIFAMVGTIVLSGPLPAITDDLEISGPGADALAISGANAHRVFAIDPAVNVGVRDLAVRDGFHSVNGAAFLNRGNLALTRTRVLANAVDGDGGGVYADAGASLAATDCDFSGNRAGSRGGALAGVAAAVLILGSRIARNVANIAGGGIAMAAGRVRMTASSCSDNSAGPDGGGGIMVDDDSAADIDNSALLRNTADGAGGAVRTRNSATTITNATIARNSAGTTGGALHADGGSLAVSFATVADNAVGLGAAVAADGGLVPVKNSIIASTTGGPNCSGAILNLGGNFSTDGSCLGFTVVTRAQLNLGPPQINPPGTTETMALLPGSVAIDAAVDCSTTAGTPVPTDQRGVGRPSGARCDAGAYEFVAAPPPRRALPQHAIFVSEGGCGSQRVRRHNPTLPFTR